MLDVIPNVVRRYIFLIISSIILFHLPTLSFSVARTSVYMKRVFFNSFNFFSYYMLFIYFFLIFTASLISSLPSVSISCLNYSFHFFHFYFDLKRSAFVFNIKQVVIIIFFLARLLVIYFKF